MCRMMIAALVFLLPTVTVAQTTNQGTNGSTCTAAMARSLTIRGIRLGMSTDEVLALFLGASENPEVKAALVNPQAPPKFGLTQTYLSPRLYSTRERFAGIDFVNATFFDDRLASYYVQYTGPPDGPAWNNLDEWIAKLSETLNLPVPGDWPRQPGNGYSRALTCDGFKIWAGNQNQRGMVGVSEENVDRKVRARDLAYQEKKRREFKP